ncbi:conserved hypothetical protein [uncultured Sporomusa sp.]|uniref:G domain-containing protein n=1 Tax=uncultured Sporomusa sp. TaxID=307249 RepID=A0A212LYP2_9FIRM|nr:GTPase [uncultured Sporomusa sp.]SCM82567.1 conserved hypothetical protein [uncultured Sporomusa sp.]
MDIDTKNYQEMLEKEFDKQRLEFEKTLKSKKLIFSLVGSVNAGKSSTINALFGKRLSEVSPRAGWTKEVQLFHLTDNVVIADTPGLEDVNEEISKKTAEFIEKDTDIIVFFLQAGAGIRSEEKKAIDAYKSFKKPLLLVLNKVDIWYEGGVLTDKDDYEETLKQIYEITGIYPIPISAKKGIDIDRLHTHIESIVESLGKEVLYAKASTFRDEIAKKWINRAAAAAAAIGALPIPGADMLPLTTLQVGLAMKIAYIYGYQPSKNDAMKLIASTITGSVGKQVFRYALQLMKGAGWAGGPFGTGIVAAIAAGVASTTTYGFGHACHYYYKSGMQVDLGELGEHFDKYREQYKSSNVA